MRRYIDLEVMDAMLQYCATDNDILWTASRLELALRRKIGHTVVIGEDQDDANTFVSVVLDGIAGYQFMPFSAEDLDVSELPTPARKPRAIAVIYNANLLSSEALEQLRVWTECSRTAIGLLLVGTDKLAQRLAQPEARVLAGLVHTHIGLVRPRIGRDGRVSDEPSSRRRALANLIVAGAAAVCIGLAASAQGLQQQPVVTAMRDAFASGVAWLPAHLPLPAGSVAVLERLVAAAPATSSVESDPLQTPARELPSTPAAK